MNRWVLAVLCGVVAAALGGVSWADEAKEPEGKTLFLKYKCNSCHSVETVGIVKKAGEVGKEEAAVTPAATPAVTPTATPAVTPAAPPAVTPAATPAAPKKKSPDLSGVGLDVKADWIVKFLKKQETTKEGKKHLKLFKGTDKELQVIAGWLETMKTAKTGTTAGKVSATEKAEKVEPAEKAEAVEKADTAKVAPQTETK